MTEFFYNRYGTDKDSLVEAFSDPKEYNQVYVDQAGVCPNPPYEGSCDAATSTANCLCEYKANAAKYDKLVVKNNTTNGSFGDSKDKHSEIIISNINLGIGIAIMMSYIYSFSEK